jgi:hypothetical protein
MVQPLAQFALATLVLLHASQRQVLSIQEYPYPYC